VRLRALLVPALAAAVGVAVARRLSSTRARRNRQLAGVGSRVGARYAAHRARAVFASAERKEELAAEFELRSAEEVARALGNMKGAVMKLGQLASFLDDGLPEPVREALATLQQDAPPMAPELAADTIERELGQPPDQLFAEWDPVPIAAASIGQVHRAVTRDDVAVAVKVQYPGVAEAIAADLDNSDLLFSMIGMLMPGFEPAPLVEELRQRLSEELDYRREAANQQRFVDFYRGHPFIHIPGVLPSLSTERVLTTELATGARFRELETWSQDEKNLAGEAIYRFVFRSIYSMHAFNGDPHPGNYLFHPGGQVTFLDFGLVKHFNAQEVEDFEELIRHAVVEPDPAAYRARLEATDLLKPGAPVSDADIAQFFGHFYEILRVDAPTAFTHEYATELVQRLFDVTGRFGEIAKWANLPPHFVIVQRINMGLYSLLASLGATANWKRIAEELWPMTQGPPSTELGRKEAAWLAAGDFGYHS
jgi:predicted unusual protein kinase regulating ubiquinone biosynthesis (AarF/ABC1/UbiB family)